MHYAIGNCFLLAVLALTLCGCGISQPSGPPGTQPSGYRLQLDAAPAERQPNTVGIFLCCDVSGSMNDHVGSQTKMAIAKDALREVFAQIAAYAQAHPERKVHVGLCTFSNSAQVVVPLSPFDQRKLENAVAALHASGGTAIGDAMALAMNELHNAGMETRAMIVVTDGENNRGTPPHEVMHAIRTSQNNRQAATGDTVVYLVAFDINASVFSDVKSAGAAVKDARDAKALREMLDTVVEEVLLEK